jgi:hypothetical protein
LHLEATRAQGDEMAGAENEATEHDVRQETSSDNLPLEQSTNFTFLPTVGYFAEANN